MLRDINSYGIKLSLSHPFTMSTPPSTLNPSAPEYTPLSPGVAPNPHAPPPNYFPPPPTAAFRPPPSPRRPRPYFTLPPSTPQQYHFYYVTQPQNPIIATTQPSTPPPPPRPEVSDHLRRRARGRERESFRSERVKRSWGSYRRGMQRKGSLIRHKVLPLKRDDEQQTTVMIKNIPYHCPRKELIRVLDNFCSSENAKASANEGTSRAHDFISAAYDFLYLPIDFRTKRSRGFAFVNFTNAVTVWKFVDAFDDKYWDSEERSTWPKKIEVVSAKIQGKEALERHFSGSAFECESDEFLPVLFDPPRDGSGQLPVVLTVIGSRRASRMSWRTSQS